MALTPAQRSLRARIAALASHEQHDPRERMARARATFDERFLDEVDPRRVLPEAERLRRADLARRRYFTQLAFKSSRARQKRAENGGAA